jgi:hypothetical protein
MVTSLQATRDSHLEMIHQSQIYQARHSDARIKATVQAPSSLFPIGSYVTVTYPNRPPSKLHSKLRGPFIVKSITNDAYFCEDLPTGKILTFYADRLRQYVYSDQHALQPLEVATRDRGEFIIDRIIDHSGTQGRKYSMDFLVRWLGFDEAEDLWLRYSDVNQTSALQEYLIAAVAQGHRLQKLIDPLYIPQGDMAR